MVEERVDSSEGSDRSSGSDDEEESWMCGSMTRMVMMACQRMEAHAVLSLVLALAHAA